MKAVNVSPIEIKKIVDDSPVGVVDDGPVGVVYDSPVGVVDDSAAPRFLI
jgi:hypothetical protein